MKFLYFLIIVIAVYNVQFSYYSFMGAKVGERTANRNLKCDFQDRFQGWFRLQPTKMLQKSCKTMLHYNHQRRNIYQGVRRSILAPVDSKGIAMDSQLNKRSAWSGGGQSGRLGIEFGHAQVEGTGPHPIEDYHVSTVKPFGHGDRIGLFAIFDGHGGTEVANYLKENIFEAILDHPKFSTDPQLAIRESYMTIDQRILDMGEMSKAWRAGSTATTAFLKDKGRRLVVANVGDSRAVLSRGGVAVDLSVDHEPQKPEERQMVESKGGEVSKTMSWDVYRVDRQLAMSRAFGDYNLKAHITVEPDIWDGELTATDEFLIVASDGLWHVMSSQEAVDLASEAPNAKRAAKSLINAAVDRFSHDDISVLVVGLGAVV